MAVTLLALSAGAVSGLASHTAPRLLTHRAARPRRAAFVSMGAEEGGRDDKSLPADSQRRNFIGNGILGTTTFLLGDIIGEVELPDDEKTPQRPAAPKPAAIPPEPQAVKPGQPQEKPPPPSPPPVVAAAPPPLPQELPLPPPPTPAPPPPATGKVAPPPPAPLPAAPPLLSTSPVSTASAEGIGQGELVAAVVLPAVFAAVVLKSPLKTGAAEASGGSPAATGRSAPEIMVAEGPAAVQKASLAVERAEKAVDSAVKAVSEELEARFSASPTTLKTKPLKFRSDVSQTSLPGEARAAATTAVATAPSEAVVTASTAVATATVDPDPIIPVPTPTGSNGVAEPAVSTITSPPPTAPTEALPTAQEASVFSAVISKPEPLRESAGPASALSASLGPSGTSKNWSSEFASKYTSASQASRQGLAAATATVQDVPVVPPKTLAPVAAPAGTSVAAPRGAPAGGLTPDGGRRRRPNRLLTGAAGMTALCLLYVLVPWKNLASVASLYSSMADAYGLLPPQVAEAFGHVSGRWIPALRSVVVGGMASCVHFIELLAAAAAAAAATGLSGVEAGLGASRLFATSTLLPYTAHMASLISVLIYSGWAHAVSALTNVWEAAAALFAPGGAVAAFWTSAAKATDAAATYASKPAVVGLTVLKTSAKGQLVLKIGMLLKMILASGNAIAAAVATASIANGAIAAAAASSAGAAVGAAATAGAGAIAAKLVVAHALLLAFFHRLAAAAAVALAQLGAATTGDGVLHDGLGAVWSTAGVTFTAAGSGIRSAASAITAAASAAAAAAGPPLSAASAVTSAKAAIALSSAGHALAATTSAVGPLLQSLGDASATVLSAGASAGTAAGAAVCRGAVSACAATVAAANAGAAAAAPQLAAAGATIREGVLTTNAAGGQAVATIGTQCAALFANLLAVCSGAIAGAATFGSAVGATTLSAVAVTAAACSYFASGAAATIKLVCTAVAAALRFWVASALGVLGPAASSSAAAAAAALVSLQAGLSAGLAALGPVTASLAAATAGAAATLAAATAGAAAMALTSLQSAIAAGLAAVGPVAASLATALMGATTAVLAAVKAGAVICMQTSLLTLAIVKALFASAVTKSTFFAVECASKAAALLQGFGA